MSVNLPYPVSFAVRNISKHNKYWLSSITYFFKLGFDNLSIIVEYDEPSCLGIFLRNGSGFEATLKIPTSLVSKFLIDVDFPEPLSPRINTGIPIIQPPPRMEDMLR